MTEKLYTVGEFARLIGRSQGFVRTLCDAGVITCYRPTGMRLIPESATEELKTNRMAPVKAPKPTVARHRGSDLRVVPTYKRA